MPQNREKAGANEHPAENIDTICIDPQIVIREYERNLDRLDGISSRVIRIDPPFESQVKGKPFVGNPENLYRPEMTPKPLHIDPVAFIEEDDIQIAFPTRENTRSLIKEEPDVTLSEDQIEEWYTEARETWRETIRSSLKESIAVELLGGRVTLGADVEYL